MITENNCTLESTPFCRDALILKSKVLKQDASQRKAIDSMLQQTIPTPFGPLTATWTSRGLYACEFARSGPSASRREICQRDETAGEFDPAHAERLTRTIEDYFAHGQLAWDLDSLDWRGVSNFHQTVLRGCFQIPAGATLTYGALAARAGSPKAARAVGAAMARNRWPILIPCHRVVGSTGALTGYSGTGGIATKRHLLALEHEQTAFTLASH